MCYFSFFFNDTATTEIYTLSLHDALPILGSTWEDPACELGVWVCRLDLQEVRGWTYFSLPQSIRRIEASELPVDRKSTRLNSSHANISYAVFCLKKKKQL